MPVDRLEAEGYGCLALRRLSQKAGSRCRSDTGRRREVATPRRRLLLGDGGDPAQVARRARDRGRATPAAALRTHATTTSTTGAPGHAEAVRIVFDPTRTSLRDDCWSCFFRMHDPTTPNRQGNDIGTQYRSAIFYQSDAQRQIAEKVKAAVADVGKWKRPDHDGDHPGLELLVGRGVPPGLPGEAPRRLHLPLRAEVGERGGHRSGSAVASESARCRRSPTPRSEAPLSR